MATAIGLSPCEPIHPAKKRGARCQGEISGLDWQPSHLQFGEFYILSHYRSQGLGTRMLQSILAQADARGVPTHLEFLKWNPVGTLYLRHGFKVVSETEIHFLAVRPLNAR